MERNKQLDDLLEGLVINDSVSGLPPHNGKFADDGGLKLPIRAFTETEILAARMASTGTWDEEELARRSRK